MDLLQPALNNGITLMDAINMETAKIYLALKRAGFGGIYFVEVYLVTALVPSETACLASSPGSRSLTAV